MKKFYCLLFLLILPCLILLCGCGEQKELKFRVQDGYVQYTYEGEEEWKNAFSVDEIGGQTQIEQNEELFDFYPFDDGTYAVGAGKNTELSEIVIPATHNGKSVTKIVEYGFYRLYSLKKITLPNSITIIGESAFSSCLSLASVAIPSSVKIIEQNAFRECDQLFEVYNLSNIKITIGSTENGYVGYYAKKIHSSLSEKSIYVTTNGVVYYKENDKKIVLSLSDYSLKNLILDSDCTEISKYAFNNCTNLISVTIPSSVTSIGSYAFRFCINLVRVTFKDPYAWGTSSFSFDASDLSNTSIAVEYLTEKYNYLTWSKSNLYSSVRFYTTDVYVDCSATIYQSVDGINWQQVKQETNSSYIDISGIKTPKTENINLKSALNLNYKYYKIEVSIKNVGVNAVKIDLNDTSSFSNATAQTGVQTENLNNLEKDCTYTYYRIASITDISKYSEMSFDDFLIVTRK